MFTFVCVCIKVCVFVLAITAGAYFFPLLFCSRLAVDITFPSSSGEIKGNDIKRSVRERDLAQRHFKAAPLVHGRDW